MIDGPAAWRFPGRRLRENKLARRVRCKERFSLFLYTL